MRAPKRYVSALLLTALLLALSGCALSGSRLWDASESFGVDPRAKQIERNLSSGRPTDFGL